MKGIFCRRICQFVISQDGRFRCSVCAGHAVRKQAYQQPLHHSGDDHASHRARYSAHTEHSGRE